MQKGTPFARITSTCKLTFLCFSLTSLDASICSGLGFRDCLFLANFPLISSMSRPYVHSAILASLAVVGQFFMSSLLSHRQCLRKVGLPILRFNFIACIALSNSLVEKYVLFSSTVCKYEEYNLHCFYIFTRCIYT